MALNLDVSELTQAAAMKATPHDNCVVLDLGTGTFPRDIEVRLPDDDGARQNALWDGSLNLSVNDEVLCFEYSGLSAWRVMGMGGNDGGAGKVRVSEVWESDFGAVALQSDADGKIGIGTAGPDAKLEALTTAGAQLRLTFENEVKFADFTVDANHNLAIDPTSTGEIKLNATVTVLDEIQRKGDADTKVSFTDDKFSLTVGGLLMLEATEIAGQDTLALGDVGGGGDVDIDFNDGQMFLQGSNGALGLGIISIASFASFEIKRTNDNVIIDLNQTGAGNFLSGVFCFTDDNSANFSAYDDAYTDVSEYAGKVGFQVSGGPGFFSSIDAGGIFEIYTGGRAASNKHFVLAANGDLAVKGATTTAPNTRLDIGAGAIEQAEMTAPGAGAANATRTYAEDNAGTTRQRIKFSSGNAVTIAEDGGLQTYTVTNVVTDRAYDANSTTLAEIADVLGTLIADFQAAGVLG